MTSPHPSPRARILSAALIASSLLAGCGSGPSDDRTAAASTSTTGTTGTTGEMVDAARYPGGAPTTAVEAAGPEPGLIAAFDQAQRQATAAGHHLVVNSGHRTVERQEELLAEAVVDYGSWEEATRWVFPPERSMHVRGLALDVGDRAAAEWLAGNGARWGLCRTLDWEWWHFEWRSRWEQARSCPAPASDPADAPAA